MSGSIRIGTVYHVGARLCEGGTWCEIGKTGIGAANHSLGNIRCSAGYSCQDGFRSYATWGESYQDWYNLILNGYVKGSVSDACPCTTIEQIIPVYAPSSDGNDVQGYIAALLQAAHTWRAGGIVV